MDWMGGGGWRLRGGQRLGSPFERAPRLRVVRCSVERRRSTETSRCVRRGRRLNHGAAARLERAPLWQPVPNRLRRHRRTARVEELSVALHPLSVVDSRDPHAVGLDRRDLLARARATRAHPPPARALVLAVLHLLYLLRSVRDLVVHAIPPARVSSA